MPDKAWQQSSYCGGGGNNCVQAKREGTAIHLRESQRPDDEITMTPDQFAAFVQGVKAGEFDHLI
ncbi:DUF397 domain-containing protein [Streptomyces jumonjinensis]|uniref:DUF397 domain-containing protein n=1 Tax=Streptomyces jumonjinensis TaxID=1945 RepID=A0A646KGG0_STRJU|nr:DUF397 domain-containing protein [Streptomyces jumonjinensis]MQT01359.1 DUF397 domain-containing protein [Streptomyces jumonjinensis]